MYIKKLTFEKVNEQWNFPEWIFWSVAKPPGSSSWFAHPNHQMWISERVLCSSCRVAERVDPPSAPWCWVTTGRCHQPLSQLCNLATSFRMYNWVLLRSILEDWQMTVLKYVHGLDFSFQPKNQMHSSDHFPAFNWREHVVKCGASKWMVSDWSVMGWVIWVVYPPLGRALHSQQTVGTRRNDPRRLSHRTLS